MPNSDIRWHVKVGFTAAFAIVLILVKILADRLCVLFLRVALLLEFISTWQLPKMSLLKRDVLTGQMARRMNSFIVCAACGVTILLHVLLRASNFSNALPHRSSQAGAANIANHERDLKRALESAKLLLNHMDSTVNAHNQLMEELASTKNRDTICSKASHHIDLPFPWFIFKPTWNCLAKERVGNKFDGGKWHCNINAIRKHPRCIVYSLGSNADVGYELAIRDRTDCEIHVFDPTVSKKKVQPMLPKNAYFHEIGIAGHTGSMDIDGKLYKVSTIKDVMTELGHERVSVLKMDIEGNEYAAIDALDLSNALKTAIDELLIEFHWRGAPLAVNAFERILRAGFRIFSNEPNLFYRTLPAAGIEYSFIHERVADDYNM
jgi:FkbM family methyltransferase